MFDTQFKRQVENLLEPAGISINGTNAWDIRVHDSRLFQRILAHGNLGFGEAYMDAWWDCDAIDELFFRILHNRINKKIATFGIFASSLAGRIFNLQIPSRAFTVGERHYNTGNDLFSLMLDTGMNYSCAYWENCNNLEQAQQKKLQLIFDKLKLKPGMKVLDIGCGWGGAALYAAKHYGVNVTGITVSNKQAQFAQQFCNDPSVSIKLCDYRSLNDKYDRIYSIGMFEHVGHKNYRHYFEVIDQCLAKDGLCLIHTIGGNEPSTSTDPWISKYIFPNSMIPAASQITDAYEGIFVLEDWHVFAHDYYLTLKSWHQNVQKNLEKLNQQYSERFFRMWKYYLLSCAGAFRARKLQIWQILLSPQGIKGLYRVPR
ncbi:cyclopropane fatty acyl phospholipid synthase [Prosthecochloris sp. SCSIO W1101]|uniref:cyclopropane fatty acyl phospholipid synthase n=1 Tax=Prosthecochloris sp. SCSIO W1101 TaxID=2992242 RepID=UPI00223D1E6B|nr:cyclopropane fatty acyl phospholipid synthase [Prosthecochloris sp. SCSIO W1101]UZJ40274.1 cyclopropane fatty acyl phospholipid synthase [Prosthecochloris sp. SCSIO W1101]